MLAKSIRKAGELGSSAIPDRLKTNKSHSGLTFTVINNSQALELAKASD